MPAVSFKTFVQGSTAASTPLGGTEQIVIIQGNAVVQCVADDLGGGAASYSVYTAVLSQSGTDDPIATVLQNTLSGDVTWTRSGTGDYHATLTGEFLENKVACFATPDYSGGNAPLISFIRFNDDYCRLQSLLGDGNNVDISDNGTGATSVEIRVYP